MAEAVRNPIFTLPSTYQRKIDLDLVDYVERLISTMVEHTNAKISDDAQKVTELEMPLHWNYVCYDNMSYEQYQRALECQRWCQR